MSAAEILLIIIGIVIFVLGYFLPARKKDVDEEVKLISEDEIRKLIANQTSDVQDKIADIVDETVRYTMEKTERSMEKICNEKILAIGEYSDTVLGEINKNHKEVVFLYDMLNDKHEVLVSTINEITATTDEIRQTVKDAEVTASETVKKLEDVQSTVSKPSDYAQAQSVEFAPAFAAEEKREMDAFSPIVAKRVEIIEEPVTIQANEVVGQATGVEENTEKIADGHVEAPVKELATEDVKEKEPVKRKAKAAKASKQISTEGKTEEAPEVDLQFTQGKDNGKNNNERILELHKAGKSNMAIAKQLGLGLGEVKLVIDLFEG